MGHIQMVMRVSESNGSTGVTLMGKHLVQAVPFMYPLQCPTGKIYKHCKYVDGDHFEINTKTIC